METTYNPNYLLGRVEYLLFKLSKIKPCVDSYVSHINHENKNRSQYLIDISPKVKLSKSEVDSGMLMDYFKDCCHYITVKKTRNSDVVCIDFLKPSKFDRKSIFVKECDKTTWASDHFKHRPIGVGVDVSGSYSDVKSTIDSSISLLEEFTKHIDTHSASVQLGLSEIKSLARIESSIRQYESK